MQFHNLHFVMSMTALIFHLDLGDGFTLSVSRELILSVFAGDCKQRAKYVFWRWKEVCE